MTEEIKDETAIVPANTSLELSAEDQALLEQAREATGENKRGDYLNVPEIQVNNFTEEKEVNGEMVTPRPDRTFVIKSKNDQGAWIETPVGAEFTGVLLKVRFRLESKFGTPMWFRSNEFSDFKTATVVVKTGKANNNETIFVGSYAEAKEQMKMKNKKGEIVKSFDLIALAYVKIGDEIFKVKTKIGKDAPLFVYTSSFGKNSSFLAFETVFSLAWKEATSTVKFWEIEYTVGNRSDLGANLATVNKMNEIFDRMDGTGRVQSTGNVMELDHGDSQIGPDEDYSQPEEDDIKIEDIPF